MSETPLPMRIPLHPLQVKTLAALAAKVQAAQTEQNIYAVAILQGAGLDGEIRFHLEGEELVVDP